MGDIFRIGLPCAGGGETTPPNWRPDVTGGRNEFMKWSFTFLAAASLSYLLLSSSKFINGGCEEEEGGPPGFAPVMGTHGCELFAAILCKYG